MYGVTADVRITDGTPPLENTPAAAAWAATAVRDVLGEAGLVPLGTTNMGGEDFAYMLNAKQGAYLMLGTARSRDEAPLHHPKYDFNDEMLPVGASWWATLAEQLLPRS